MKNKRNTYLLLASVVIIWGIIIYKMTHTLSPDKKVAETGKLLAGFKPKPVQEKDVFDVSVHQRDPFLGTFIAPEIKTKRIAKRKPVAQKQEAVPIPVNFSGMITDKNSGEKIFFVSVNNRQYLMKINDEVQEVKLVKGNAKAISIRYKNQLKTISITP